MSQYKDGTASVFNNSNIVTGSGTLWLASISAGDLFTKAGDDVAYTVAGVTNNTILTLTAPYGGSSSSGSNYGITIGFTAGGLPLLSAGDLNTAAIYNEAMKGIDNYNLSNLGTAAFAGLTTTTTDVTAGRVLKTGDGDLLLNTEASTTSNINTRLHSCFFTYNDNSTGAPTTARGTAIQTWRSATSNSLRSHQLIMSNDSLFLRRNNNGTWLSSVEFWSTENTIVDVNDFIKQL